MAHGRSHGGVTMIVYLLTHSVAYENTYVKGVFSNYAEASKVRAKLIYNNQKQRLFHLDEEQWDGEHFDSIGIGDEVFCIKTIRLNKELKE